MIKIATIKGVDFPEDEKFELLPLELRLSIKSRRKWFDIYHNDGVDVGGGNCALCILYKDCESCLIKSETGKTGCGGTPYSNWITHQCTHIDDLYMFLKLKQSTCGLKIECPVCKRIAGQEFWFIDKLIIKCFGEKYHMRLKRTTI